MSEQASNGERTLSYRARSRVAAAKAKETRARTVKKAKLGLLASTSGLAIVLALAIPGEASAATGTQAIDISAIQQFTNGLAFYALLTCVVGIGISSAMWAMGSKGQNAGTELIGKKGLIVCCAGAFFVGAASPMANWLNQQASNSDVDQAHVTQYQPFTFTNSGGTAGAVGSAAGAAAGAAGAAAGAASSPTPQSGTSSGGTASNPYPNAQTNCSGATIGVGCGVK